jgi:polyhydroxyalkanoate synthase
MTVKRGTRERGGSVWLGQPSAPSDVFRQYRDVDRWLLSSLSQFSGGLAPATLAGAALDWWTHLLASPAKQLEVAQVLSEASVRLSGWCCGDGVTPPCPFEPLPQDKRFAAPAWQQWPFNVYAQAFLLAQHALTHATSGVPGVTRHHEAMVAFGARQWLDMLSPSNGVLTNPQVLERTLASGGTNLLHGLVHAAEDALRDALSLPPAGAQDYVVGGNVAVTPGKVVMRNRLAELIQYEPTTPRTHRQPILLLPAWIMKYYVLDLSPDNSLVKALVDRGFTVFAVSWKNPTAEDRETSLADYFNLGMLAALDAIGLIMPREPVHAVGYCLGGTLLAMGAAALARTRPHALRSITLLAAQTDFTDPGELSLFIDEGQVEMLDDMMWRQGVLKARQLSGAFQMLRSQDLVWSYRVINYLMGERQHFSDLMAWNADGTRLPYRMHSEYLHSLFLENALARGQARLNGDSINLADIRVPIFSVGAVQDHVAPWRSVFKLHALTEAPQTFVLTAGGHNVGIVNPPGHAVTSYRSLARHAGERLLTPEEWLSAAPQTEGSWWLGWFGWLERHSSGERKPPAMGAPRKGLPVLADAPGSYVMER